MLFRKETAVSRENMSTNASLASVGPWRLLSWFLYILENIPSYWKLKVINISRSGGRRRTLTVTAAENYCHAGELYQSQQTSILCNNEMSIYTTQNIIYLCRTTITK